MWFYFVLTENGPELKDCSTLDRPDWANPPIGGSATPWSQIRHSSFSHLRKNRERRNRRSGNLVETDDCFCDFHINIYIYIYMLGEDSFLRFFF